MRFRVGLLRWPRPSRRMEANPSKGPKTPARPPSHRCSVIFYAVVSDQIHQVIQFFGTPAEAEAMLETVLEDEPHLQDLLYVPRVELVTGGLNQRVTHPTSAAIYRYIPHIPDRVR